MQHTNNPYELKIHKSNKQSHSSKANTPSQSRKQTVFIANPALYKGGYRKKSHNSTHLRHKVYMSPVDNCLQECVMTCYFRHLKELLKKAGIEVPPQNRQEIDRISHSIVGVNYKNCPATWKQVKKSIMEDETAFVSNLNNAWTHRKTS